MRFCLCQISNSRINPPAGTLAEQFYETFWAKKAGDGYHRPADFWELPLWIGEFSHAVIAAGHNVALHVVKPGVDTLPTWSDNIPTVYCFSVLEVNRGHVETVIRANPELEYCCGGYIDGRAWIWTLPSRVVWFDTIRAAIEAAGLKYTAGVNWDLFAGTRTIPRLTLSTGCHNHCRFCTVPKTIQERTRADVYQQIDAMWVLNFELVYLNDKTFGQAKNAGMLAALYLYIRSQNPAFRGFIVQTTAAEVMRRPANYWTRLGGVVVELGIETYNDSLLQKYKKPQTTKTIDAAVDRLVGSGVRVIANIILGLIGETLTTANDTARWIYRRRRDLYGLNVYTLALYRDADLANDVDKVTDADSNELAETRSFWTAADKDLFDRQSTYIYVMGIFIAGGNFPVNAGGGLTI